LKKRQTNLTTGDYGDYGTMVLGAYFLLRTMGTMGTMVLRAYFLLRTIGTMGTMNFEDIIFFPVLKAIYFFNFIFTQSPG
jgi:hypothetical protein